MGEIPEVCGSLDKVTVLWSGMILSVFLCPGGFVLPWAVQVFMHHVLMGLGWPHSVYGAGKYSVCYAGGKNSQETSAGQNSTLLFGWNWL